MIHVILRLALLGYNVLDSFKTLKPKVRRGQDAPSARAVAQRKRDMKGILCVWVVSVSAFSFVAATCPSPPFDDI